jgi:hypothetical protein
MFNLTTPENLFIHLYKNTSTNINIGDKMQYIKHESETLFHPAPTIQELLTLFL